LRVKHLSGMPDGHMRSRHPEGPRFHQRPEGSPADAALSQGDLPLRLKIACARDDANEKPAIQLETDPPLILLDIRLMFANNAGMAITRRQREVYDFISRFVAEHGYSPSFEEIGNGLDLNSLATVHKHITNLEKKGLLTRDYNRSRSIDLLPPKGRLKQAMSVNTGVILPLVGRIAAGLPIEAVQNNETISLADFVRSKEVFVLEVRGDSMQDEAILNGDYVLVEKLKTAHNGDIVVAVVNRDDATLKRFYREGDNIRLQPSNANMQPIIVPAESVEIQGRVIGVLRKY
jgi:repressor LexA